MNEKIESMTIADLCLEIEEYAVDQDEYGEFLSFLSRISDYQGFFTEEFVPLLREELAAHFKWLRENYEIVREDKKITRTIVRKKLIPKEGK